MASESPRKDRDENGKFVKGHKVPSPRTGRMRKEQRFPILVAITQMAYTPEELVEMLHETWAVAKESQDGKAMLQVIQLVLNYAVGKPVQRTLSATVDPDKLRALFGEDNQDDRESNTEVAGESFIEYSGEEGSRTEGEASGGGDAGEGL